MRSLLIMSMLAAASLAHGQVYQCPGPDGRRVFQQSPCDGGKKLEVKPASGPSAGAPTASPAAPAAVGMSADERVLATMQRDRLARERQYRIRDLQAAIAQIEQGISQRNAQMTAELDQLSRRKAMANNNLAGATLEHSISAEMQAVTQKYKTMNDADFERLRVMRSELEALQRGG